jgi:hypothetical protein
MIPTDRYEAALEVAGINLAESVEHVVALGHQLLEEREQGSYSEDLFETFAAWLTAAQDGLAAFAVIEALGRETGA